MDFKNNLLFTGNSNINLANKIAKKLKINLGKIKIFKFSDGEIMVEILENVRNKNIFLIQSICNPVNENFMEMMIIIDAFKRACVKNIFIIIPYLGYSRQDRRIYPLQSPITSKLIADIISNSGIKQIIVLDIHNDQIQAFFNIPIDNINTTSILLKNLFKKKINNLVIVSPDIGSIKRTMNISKILNCNLVIINKNRNTYNNLEITNIIGDVYNLNCIIIDDIIDTALTITKVAKILKQKGAKKIISYCTHAVLSGNSINYINKSCLDELIVLDTIPILNKKKYCTKIKQLSCDTLIVKILKKYLNY